MTAELLMWLLGVSTAVNGFFFAAVLQKINSIAKTQGGHGRELAGLRVAITGRLTPSANLTD